MPGVFPGFSRVTLPDRLSRGQRGGGRAHARYPRRPAPATIECREIPIPAADAVAFAERIRATIADHDFDPVGRVTASFGIAEVAAEDESMRSLHGRADQALYRAKRDGRNRVVRYCGEDTDSLADTGETR